MTAIGFDVYGTLINTHGVISMLEEMIAEQAAPFSMAWRDKQLEYSFRRALMEDYVDFNLCTAQALAYTNEQFGGLLDSRQQQMLLDLYRSLPAFKDVAAALEAIKDTNLKLFAFSNGTEAAVEGLLQHAEIPGYFDGIISVESLKTFKPNPRVYQYFLERTNTDANNSWLISGNPFDILGAQNIGMNTVWVQRNKASVFDPWQREPTATISDLSELSAIVNQR